LVVLNLDDPAGDELSGTSPMHHLDVIARFAPRMRLDVVLADTSLSRYGQALNEKVEAMGARLVLWDLAQDEAKNYHESEKLAPAFRHIFGAESVR
jgi:2-phospho-L-lactate transferase/gluconeogenesis factor (CofD/UPF0052 family)